MYDEYDDYGYQPDDSTDDDYLLYNEFEYGNGDPSDGWEVDGIDGDDF